MEKFHFSSSMQGVFFPLPGEIGTTKERGIVAAFLFAYPNHDRSSRLLLFKEKSFKLLL